jgi:urea transport system permease protein
MNLSKKYIPYLLWALALALFIAMPSLVSDSRLKILGKCLSLGIVALGIDLSWGFTGLLSLGQGIFFFFRWICHRHVSPVKYLKRGYT